MPPALAAALKPLAAHHVLRPRPPTRAVRNGVPLLARAAARSQRLVSYQGLSPDSQQTCGSPLAAPGRSNLIRSLALGAVRRSHGALSSPV